MAYVWSNSFRRLRIVFRQHKFILSLGGDSRASLGRSPEAQPGETATETGSYEAVDEEVGGRVKKEKAAGEVVGTPHQFVVEME